MSRLVCLLAAAWCLPVVAQTPNSDPFSPGIHVATGTPGAFPELATLGTQVQQIGLNPYPMGKGYLGSATVVRAGRSDSDPITFTWAGPGNPPVLDGADGSLYTGALISTGSEFAFNLRLDGLVGVTDTGAAHPVGLGNAVIAARTDLVSSFTNVIPIKGIAPGYVDPTLGVIGGKDVLFWIDVAGDIRVGEIVTNSASPSFGNVTSPRVAILLDTVSFPGLQFWHSTSSIYDHGKGATMALLAGGYVVGTGSDGYYQSYPDQSAVIGGGIRPQRLVDDGSHWNANPGNLGGTALFADAPTGYGDPLRVDFLGLCSTVVTGASGGTLSVGTHVPLSMDPPNTAVWINFGDPLATPVSQATLQAAFGGLGLTVYGGLGMFVAFSIPARLSGTLAKVEVPVKPIMGMASFHAEAIAWNKTTGDVMLSNVSRVIVQ